MGKKAIPLILHELWQGPDFWFAALRALNQEYDPVPDEARGNLGRMTEAWIKWGVGAGYLKPPRALDANGD